MAAVRTRFAPSPTGFMHVGGVRTALFAWLVAKQAGGHFLLRIEDTDRDRHVEIAEKHTMDSLTWLGLEWDEEPVRQSQRLEIYQDWAQKLVNSGRAYADSRTPEELEQLRTKATLEKRPILFRDHRPDSPPAWQKGQPLRFRSEPKNYSWHDEVMGDLGTGPEVVDDFIIIKSDGFPTYNFAHIIDDHLMGISHVIRSQEFLPSVPKFLNLYEALDIKRPKLATLPFVMAAGGTKKLSKRDGAKDVLDYKKLGFLPEAMVSFLATLGWNDGTEQEIYSRDELIKKFSLDRVQKSGAHFDEKRLEWVNGHFIREMPLEELYEEIEAGRFWPSSAEGAAIFYKKEVLRLIQERLKYLAEVPDLTDFFFRQDYVLDEELLVSSGGNLGDPVEVLKTVKGELSQSDFSSEDLEKRLRNLVSELNAKPQDLFGLIRVAITGKNIAPGLWELIHTINKSSSGEPLRRLDRAISLLEKQT